MPRWILTVEYDEHAHAKNIAAMLISTYPASWKFAYVDDGGREAWAETGVGHDANGKRV